MTPFRAQLSSLVVGGLLALGLLWGAVYHLAGSRRDLVQEMHAARALAAARGELLDAAERARVLAEEQRADARHALFLAHLEGAAAALAAGRLGAFDRHAALVPEEHRGWAYAVLQRRRASSVTALAEHRGELAALAGAAGRFASASRDGSVRLWSAPPAGPRLEGVIRVDREVSSLAFDLAGERVAIGADDGTLSLHDRATGKELRRTIFEERVSALAFLPDASRMVVGLFDGSTLLWASDDGTPPRRLTRQAGPVNALACSADGRLAAAASDDTTIHLLSGAELSTLTRLEGHGDWVRALAFDASARRLVSGAEDGTVRVWETETGAQVSSESHADAILAARFLGTGEVFAVSVRGEATGLHLPVPEDRYLELAAIAPDGRWLVFSTGEAQLALWRAAVPGPAQHPLASEARSVAASQEGEILVVGCVGGVVRVLEGASGRVLHEWPAADAAAPRVSVSADGTLVAAADLDGIRIWSTETGELARHLAPAADRVHDLALARDGERITAVVNDGRQWTWRVASGELLHESPAPQAFLFLVRAGRDARRFAWVGDAGTIRVWDALSGKRLAALRERTLGRIGDLDLSGNGKRLVLLSGDHEVSSCDLEHSTLLARARRPERSFRSIAVHPTGECFATGALDGSVHVWDTESCSLFLELTGEGPAVTDLAFSPDGSRLVVVRAAGRVDVFDGAR